VGSACHSADTFLKSFLLNPSAITSHFIPFVQNIKVHFGYQATIQSRDNLISMQCKFCSWSTLAVQLPQPRETNKRGEIKKQIILGDKICFACREDKFKQGKTEFKEERKGDQVFSLAEKSYIPLDTKNK
jgi:hypothetical protein